MSIHEVSLGEDPGSSGRCHHDLPQRMCSYCSGPTDSTDPLRPGQPVLMRVTYHQLSELRRMRLKHRPEWLGVFSCNRAGEVWPFNGYGLTDHEDRILVSHPLLSRICEVVVKARRYRGGRAGGRFFVHLDGVYLKEDYDPRAKVISFEILRKYYDE